MTPDPSLRRSFVALVLAITWIAAWLFGFGVVRFAATQAGQPGARPPVELLPVVCMIVAAVLAGLATHLGDDGRLEAVEHGRATTAELPGSHRSVLVLAPWRSHEGQPCAMTRAHIGTAVARGPARMSAPRSTVHTATSSLLAVPQSDVAAVHDLEAARRLACELDPTATSTELDARADDILAGRLLVIRRGTLPVLDVASADGAPLLSSLTGER